MSLILDALKRAERERNADAVPAPGDVAVPVAGRARPAGRRWLRIGGIAVAVVVVGALGWKLLRGAKPAPPSQPVVAQAQPQTLPAIKARPAPPAYVPPVIPGTEAVTSLDDLTDEPPVDSEPEPAIVPTPAPAPAAPAPEPAPAQPEPQAQQEPVEPSATEPAAQPETKTETPPPEIPPALTQPAPLRKFREMPPDYRADFPALKLEIHVYEKAVQQRFVMVNGRRYRQGERLAEGPQLVEIVPEGMVLEYRGEKILYPLNR